MSEKLAFIGLGVMGFPMAGHLSKAGHEVAVYNRTQSTVDRWLDTYKGTAHGTPGEAAAHADTIFFCVGNDDDVREVCYGDTGIFSGAQNGSTVVDHTTDSPGLAEELSSAAYDNGCAFLDAPLSGGQAGAENAQLTIMVGGDEETYHRTKPIMDCYAKTTKYMGEAGKGQLTKMVNQICIAGVVQGISEAFHLAEKCGLDINEVVEVISNGAAQSWQMENRAATMAEGKFDYGFAVNWMRKDLAIALDTARAYGARLPMTALVDQFYAEVQALGGGRWDTSSLIVRLRSMDR